MRTRKLEYNRVVKEPVRFGFATRVGLLGEPRMHTQPHSPQIVNLPQQGPPVGHGQHFPLVLIARMHTQGTHLWKALLFVFSLHSWSKG